MDSLHREIEIYWPDDSEEYSLKTDSRLIQTNDIVEDIFGSNFEIPKELKEKHFSQTESTDSLIKEYKDFIDKDESWSGIHDSFQSVIELKEGKNALITEELYDQFKDVSSEIKTRVSFVGSEKDWCFIALKGDKNKSPRWYFIDENENIHTDLPDVCNSLRNPINNDSIKLKWDDVSLHKFINLFKQKERELLPPKKKRALEVAEYILERKIYAKESDTNQSLKQSMRAMLNLLKPSSKDAVEFERLAEEWIEILQPYIDEKRELNKRKKTVLNLSSLKNDYKK